MSIAGSIDVVHLIQLLESNIFGVLSEALAANVEPIFADHSVIVGAGAAKKIGELISLFVLIRHFTNELSLLLKYYLGKFFEVLTSLSFCMEAMCLRASARKTLFFQFLDTLAIKLDAHSLPRNVTYQTRDPCPYFLGCEYQILAKPILESLQRFGILT